MCISFCNFDIVLFKFASNLVSLNIGYPILYQSLSFLGVFSHAIVMAAAIDTLMPSSGIISAKIGGSFGPQGTLWCKVLE